MLAKYGHRDDVDEGILDCLADIQALKQAGKLFSQDLWKDVEQEAFQHTKPVLKALCLHVAHTCNLNCEYCFASQGNYHGDRGADAPCRGQAGPGLSCQLGQPGEPGGGLSSGASP